MTDKTAKEAVELTARQSRFVEEYLVRLNGKQAAIAAGYSERSAEVTASRLLSNEKVRKVVEHRKQERSERAQITQDEVLTGIMDTIQRCRQAKPVLDRRGEQIWTEGEDGEMAPAYMFDAKNVLKGFELLGKHLGIFTEKHEHSGPNGGPIQSVTFEAKNPQEAAQAYRDLMG